MLIRKFGAAFVGLLVQFGSPTVPAANAQTSAQEPTQESVRELAGFFAGKRIQLVISLNYIVASATMGLLFVAPPGLARERISALRRAFDATMLDPEFREDAAKASMDIKPLAGEALQKPATEVAQAPAAGIERARELIGQSGAR